MSGLAGPDATSVVSDPAEASSVHARGFFGTVEGSTLTLDRFESVYLGETHRLNLVDARGRTMDWPTLFRSATRADPTFGVRYVVYRDLRQRGYVVRVSPPPVSFAVLPRGGILHKTPSKYWVEAQSERVPFDLARLADLADRAQGAKKSLLLALVDEESDLTYYKVRRPAPSGALEPTRLDHAAVGWLSGDRVVVFESDAVEALGRSQSYGSRIGDRLEVSLLEADHLRALGQLEVRDARSGRVVTPESFLRRARRLEAGFDDRRAAYRALRERRLVVKTGFKYGAHFRAYPRNPERAHARYLIRAVHADHRAPWPEIAGGVRVAQGVRKEFLIASVSEGAPVRFLSLERVRP
ncbi:MAG: tRNA-intron lyase [Thermoplasmata archaeon]|nr:tRNA-intron lyase [Thermoplasmata archaeon]MCI4359476.1 tRNA-intron lyase [Thermoplasmata archaeon]